MDKKTHIAVILVILAGVLFYSLIKALPVAIFLISALAIMELHRKGYL
ncbi:MAG: hypothetical protein QW478_04660 [Candidatus Micrarchaeaceae archaeon]